MKPVVALFGYLAFLSLASCGGGGQLHEIVFVAHNGNQVIQCKATDSAVRMTDLRFYVHDVRLVEQDGTAVKLDISPDGRWQNDRVALIDLEDGSGDCLNGTAATHAILTGFAPAGNYRELRFTLGVPESLNHGDPLTAAAPLTDSAMHWHWRSGYKFLRAGIRQGTDGYRLHLGSARCRGVIGNLQGCDASNRPTVALSNYASGKSVVVFDFAALFAAVSLDDGQPQSCEMGPDETACAAALGVLGLDANGDSAAPARAFRLRDGM